MPGSTVSNYKRIAAGIVGIGMLFLVLFSAFCIAAEADHDCTGEDCPICACLRQCENTLHQMGDGTAFQTAVLIPVVFHPVSALLYAVGFPRETPVLQKVRLNN